MGVIRVTDNWEEECCQSIGGRWEEECAAPNLVTKIIFAGFRNPGGDAIPCLMTNHIGGPISIWQCNILMLPMHQVHGCG